MSVLFSSAKNPDESELDEALNNVVSDVSMASPICYATVCVKHTCCSVLFVAVILAAVILHRVLFGFSDGNISLC